MSTAETKRELMDILEQLTRIEKGMRKIGRERRGMYSRISVIQSKATLDVATATDDKGKRLYSNEELRRAGVTLRLDENQEYKEMRGRMNELADKEDDLVIERNRLADQRLILMNEMGIPPSAASGDQTLIPE